MDKKKLQETYGMDIANYVKGVEEKQFQEQQDQQAKQPKPNIAPRSFSPEKEFLTNTDGNYVGEFEFEDGRYFTIIQTPKGFVATTPTNSGNVVNSGYFENVDDLYEDLLYNGEGDKLSSIANNSELENPAPYGEDVANIMEEGKRLGQATDVNNAISIADQRAKEQAKAGKK